MLSHTLAFLLAASNPPTNQPPVVTTTLPNYVVYATGDVVRFTLTVTDPDGDPVNARIVRAPGIMTFKPFVNEPSGSKRDVVWYPEETDGGLRELIVEAWDSVNPTVKTRSRVTFHMVGGYLGSGFETLDLDNDGDMEIVARSIRGDPQGVAAAGAFVLFTDPWPASGRANYEIFTANPPHLYTGQLGDDVCGQNLQFGDVTGDGIPDMIGMDKDRDGTVYVWRGPITNHPSTLADAVLHGTDPLGGYYHDGQSVLLDDVNNDGVLDILISFPFANVNGKKREGEVCVFKGGASMHGTPAPWSSLRIPNPGGYDGLGLTNYYEQSMWIGDVTGDGVRDVVIAASSMYSGAFGVGKLFVWKGGAALKGTPAALATLYDSTGVYEERLGTIDGDEGIRLVDVSGDGILDVVAGSSQADPGGAVYVWNGGPGMTGTRDFTAKLQVTGSTPYRRLCGCGGEGLQFADMNLDGITDVIAGASDATMWGQLYSGAMQVWAGGSLSGIVDATALLGPVAPHVRDFLADAVQGFQLVDVTGDGHPDIVTTSRFFDGAAIDSGAIHVWAASATTMHGFVPPTATLQVPNASTGDEIGSATGDYTNGWALGVQIADVTGDGINDLIAAAPYADVNGLADAGAIYVWNGGANIASGGTLAPSATLTSPNALAGDQLALKDGDGPAFQLADFDGDGILDITALCGVANTYNDDVPAQIYVWKGGASLTGTPAPAATAVSTQVDEFFGSGGEGVRFGDVTGDGQLDLIVLAPWYATATASGVGAIYVYPGGPIVNHDLQPVAILTNPSAHEYDLLGFDFYGDGRTLQIRDVDHDGFDDLVVSAPYASLPTGRGTKKYGGYTSFDSVGALYWFRGPFPSANPAPVELSVGFDLGDVALLGR